jgi:iron complex transport system substrate-binding protein
MRFARLMAVAALSFALVTGGCSAAGGGAPAANSGPAAPAVATPAAVFPVTVTDDLGRSVTIERQPERIVSLAPGDTEILYALALLPKVVGVTTMDDFPSLVKEMPKVGDFMTPNLEKIAAAKPDLVMVTGGIQTTTIKKLEGLGAKVVAVDPNSVEKLYASIEMVGRATGTPAGASSVVATMRGEVASFTAAVKGLPTKTCFVEIAQNPIYTTGSGTLIDDLIRLAGGTNVVKQKGYVGYSLEQLLKDDPQVYFVTKGSMSDPAGLAKRPGFDKLSAVVNKRVYVLDDDLVSRPGPRIALGLRAIAADLHPEAKLGQ